MKKLKLTAERRGEPSNRKLTRFGIGLCPGYGGCLRCRLAGGVHSENNLTGNVDVTSQVVTMQA